MLSAEAAAIGVVAASLGAGALLAAGSALGAIGNRLAGNCPDPPDCTGSITLPGETVTVLAVGGWIRLGHMLANVLGAIGRWFARVLNAIWTGIKSAGRWAKNTAKDAWNWVKDKFKKEDGKWSRDPKTLQDQMTLDEAKKGAGERILKSLDDPAFKGMEKWELKVKSASGNDSVVHYVRNPRTGELLDFKFKKHSNGVIP